MRGIGPPKIMQNHLSDSSNSVARDLEATRTIFDDSFIEKYWKSGSSEFAGGLGDAGEVPFGHLTVPVRAIMLFTGLSYCTPLRKKAVPVGKKVLIADARISQQIAEKQETVVSR